MKINEVEALVGITRKNIRFYEAEGLLSPRRNSENGYRDYGDADIAALRCIKLLRKLGVPLEEIRRIQTSTCTLEDAVQRHLVTLQREKDRVEASAALCRHLADSRETMAGLDAEFWLERMETMEQEGTLFMNRQKQDTKKKRFLPPVVSAVVMALLMAGCIWLYLWAFETDPLGAPPLPVLILLIAMPAAVIFGVIVALALRVKELKSDEFEDAKKY